MPRLTNLNEKQKARLQEAVDSHNVRALDSVTVNQWIWAIVRAQIIVEIDSAFVDTAREALRDAVKQDLD